MTCQIRASVFETNSSSSHSVTVSQDELADDLGISKALLRGGVIRSSLREGGYGWEWRRYYQPSAKIAYLVAQLAGLHAHGMRGKDITGAIRKNPKVDRMLAVIEKMTGCQVQVTGADSCPVDHDSVGVGVDLINDEDKLIRFIFSENSFIETGNDNSPVPVVISTDRGEEPYLANRYVASVDGGERFDMTMDGGNFFLQQQGADAIYAYVDDGVDLESLMGNLNGLVVEKVSVWSQRPESLPEECAVEDAQELVHQFLLDMTDQLPDLTISRDLRIETAFDVSKKSISDWERMESAHFTFSGVVDHHKMERLTEILMKHSGMSTDVRP
ncbi:hypothetical protein G6L37_00840 [Agrobacterium rubi]|nr:hypothetical protein [Agrobacterium rubi]NTF23937.1 hypothetical protein [Agrobacterium rubi]